MSGVNLIDFKRTIEVGERKPTKGEQSTWSKWELPKKRFDELTEPPKPGGGKMLSLGQRLGLIILLFSYSPIGLISKGALNSISGFPSSSHISP